jgi:heme/copper-type cytochrome/quinol oxidase subunit 2
MSLFLFAIYGIVLAIGSYFLIKFSGHLTTKLGWNKLIKIPLSLIFIALWIYLSYYALIYMAGFFFQV